MLKMRLARAGSKKRPFYQIVVAQATAPRDGRFIEKVGTYNPMLEKDHAQRVVLNQDRVKHWLAVGVQPTERVERFLGHAGIISMPQVKETPQKSAPKKKAQERMKEKAAAEEASQEA